MKYQLHDVSKWPFVKLLSAQCNQGFSIPWSKEMEALIDDGRRFVYAFEPATIDEQPDDYRARAVWFKYNRRTLAARCAGMLVVVKSVEEREAMHLDNVKRSKGLEVRYKAVESFEQAEREAPEFLAMP
ncbi:hypothetical protein BH10PSE17_BH10PSE17_08840 [soil metagenome]